MSKTKIDPPPEDQRGPVIVKNGMILGGLYVTKTGQIYSCRVNKYINPFGYPHYYRVKLRFKGKQYHEYVHRLVAKAFIPNKNPTKLTDVNHKDGNIYNNNVENLEWCVKRFNAKHAHDTNLIKSFKRPVIQFSPTGDKIAEFESILSASKALNLSSQAICSICQGKSRSNMTGGFRWKYKDECEVDVLPPIISKKKPAQKVQQINPKTKKIVNTHEKAVIAAKNIGCAIQSMREACMGKIKILKGFEWKYVPIDVIVPKPKIEPEIQSLEEMKNIKIDGESTSYFVTRDGRVWSQKTKRFLRSYKTRVGYLRVGLSHNGKRHCSSVHRLVAECFLDKPDELSIVVNHLNGNKGDPNTHNLEWCTHSRNGKHAHDTGLNVGRKPVIQYTKAGEKVAEFESITAAAKAIGKRASNICDMLAGRIKTAGGYVWKLK